ncbi:MAG TPA: hypothetical protein DEA08_20315 [Planctomycetes bacterium]|nr:hypothetical protein [Planctomycetota bacterium]
MTSSLRERYLRDGYVLAPGALPLELLPGLRAEIDALSAGRELGNYGVLLHDLGALAPALREVTASEGLARLAGEALGLNEVLFFQDHVINKAPGSGALNGHQDYAYWPLDERALAGAMMWVALDDADPGNGCLCFVPASHTWGERAATDFVEGANMPQQGQLPRMDWEGHAHEAAFAPCRAGDVLINHPLVWHASPANDSQRPRRALAITWLPSDTRWDPEHAPHPFNWSLQPSAGAPIEGPGFVRFSL